MKKNQLDIVQVLIVDDEKTILRLVYDVLSRLGFRAITVAHSGRQAIDLLSRQSFDLIISDWQMQDLNGIDVVEFVRTSPECKCPHVPIIMLTGNTEAHYVVRARDAGINEYLIKPFSSEQLVKRIRSIIEKPKPFVLAAGYKGPDRRHGQKPIQGVPDRRKNKKKFFFSKD
jgi:DNA-binding response OmpR family regulator